MRKFVRWLIIIGTVAIIILAYFRYYFIYGEGVKSGELNFVVYKGIIFKTYEGKLIQSGFKAKAQGSIQSYEFDFSVSDKVLAEKLMGMSGQELKLHYKEYFGRLPWRGCSKYVVDSIVTANSMEHRRGIEVNPEKNHTKKEASEAVDSI